MPAFQEMPSITKLESAELLRQELRVAYERYQAAIVRYKTMLAEEPDSETRYLDPAFAIARCAEAQALAEYMRILKVLADAP